MYNKAYDSYKDSKGLYYLVSPEWTLARTKVIECWINTIGLNAVEYIGPTLVPTEVLSRSGHLNQFKEEIFRIEGEDLCLRPETAQSLFVNLKSIRRTLKGNPLRLYQIGRSFRNERSTRDGSLRKCEFEQLELHVIAKPDWDFVTEYTPVLNEFFSKLGLNPSWIEVQDRPHYSSKTIDFYVQGVEVGCINYRGQHDLWALSQKERANLCVYEISLGLDRLVHFADRLNISSN